MAGGYVDGELRVGEVEVWRRMRDVGVCIITYWRCRVGWDAVVMRTDRALVWYGGVCGGENSGFSSLGGWLGWVGGGSGGGGETLAGARGIGATSEVPDAPDDVTSGSFSGSLNEAHRGKGRKKIPHSKVLSAASVAIEKQIAAISVLLCTMAILCLY